MTRENGIVERLRHAFAADDRGPLTSGQCPEPGEIWDASKGNSNPRDSRRIVSHLAQCPSCAVEWRMAMQERPSVSTEPGDLAPAVESTAGSHRPRRWIGVAAAAVIVVGLGGAVLFQVVFDEPAPPPAFRSSETLEIRSLVSESETLRRDSCLLSWSSAGEGATYDLEITRETLEAIVIERSLQTHEYLVPRKVLAQVPPGGRIVWRVEARLTDGQRITSGAFIHRLE